MKNHLPTFLNIKLRALLEEPRKQNTPHKGVPLAIGAQRDPEGPISQQGTFTVMDQSLG